MQRMLSNPTNGSQTPNLLVHMIDPTSLTPPEMVVLSQLLFHQIQQGNLYFSSQKIHLVPGNIFNNPEPVCKDITWQLYCLKYNISVELIKPLPLQYPGAAQNLDFNAYYFITVHTNDIVLNGLYGNLQQVIGTLYLETYKSVIFRADPVHLINPTRLSADKNKLLTAFLEHDYRCSRLESRLFERKKVMTFDPLSGKAEAVTFILTHSLTRRARSYASAIDARLLNYPHDFRYDVINPAVQFDQGSFGSVKAMHGILDMCHQHGLHFKQSKPRISKGFESDSLQIEKRMHAQTKISREFNKTVRFSELRVKSPLLFSNLDGMLIMRQMPGVSVNQLLQRDSNTHLCELDKYPLLARLELIAACLWALHAVHFKKIVHCDIKPANIIADLKASPVSAVIIDFGLSHFSNAPDLKSKGTLAFAPPETFESIAATSTQQVSPTPTLAGSKTSANTSLLPKPLDERSDVFSLGRTLSLILGASQTHFETIHEVVSLANDHKFVDLFHGVSDLTDEQKINLGDMLRSMVKRDPADRCDVLDALTIVEHVIMEQMITIPQLRKILQNTFELACECRARMIRHHGAMSCSPLSGYNVSDMYELIDMLKNYVRSHVFDKPIAIKLFLRMQHIRFLKDMDSKDAVIHTLDKMLYDYTSNKDNLEKMKTKLEAIHGETAARFKSMVNKQLEQSCHRLTLDDIHALALQYGKYYRKFLDEIQRSPIVELYNAPDMVDPTLRLGPSPC